VAHSVIIGGTGGLGQVIAQRLADRGDDLVITSRDLRRVEAATGKIDGMARAWPSICPGRSAWRTPFYRGE
jgi:short-subunit dehydrogenase